MYFKHSYFLYIYQYGLKFHVTNSIKHVGRIPFLFLGLGFGRQARCEHVSEAFCS